jgi:vitamin B12 transporter
LESSSRAFGADPRIEAGVLRSLANAGSWIFDQESFVRGSAILFLIASLALRVCLAAPSAAPIDALGGTDSDGPEAVVVTATRVPTPETEIASSITVITADDISNQQIQTLPDVLKDVPGLNLVQTGGPGGQTSIFMRGTNANHVKVFVDGIDVSDPSSLNGTFDFGQFLTQDIERIEVLRGPQSGLYGSDAIGGVISIITKAGSGPPQLTVNLQGGSFDTFNQAAGVSGSEGGFHYAANVQHLHAGSTPVTPLDLLLPGEPRNNDYYDNLTGSTRLGFDVSQQFDLGLVARFTDTHLRFTGDDPNAFPSFPEAQQNASNTHQFYTRATEHSVALDGAFEQTLGVAYSHIDSSDFTPPADGPPADNAGERLKLDWQGIAELVGAQTLIFGAERERDEIREPISAATTINSGFAELQSNFAAGLYDTLSLRYDDNDRFGSKVTYRIAPVYVIGDTGTRLKASVGTGFKAPTLEELFENFPAFDFFANPNLRPESSTGYDAGIEQTLLERRLSFGVTYFRNNIRNLIDYNADFTSYVNVGRAMTQGAESFVACQPTKSLTLRLDYTYTAATDEILHEELLRRPRHKATLNGNWQATQRLSVNATLLTVGSWIDGNRDFSVPRLTAAGYTTVNLTGNFDVSSTLSVFARIDNLFDRHYQNPVGFLQPYLGAFAGIKVKL